MEKWTKEERKAIGSRIQSVRKQRGLLQEDLANLVGLKVGTISKYEQGDRTPGIRQLSHIAEVLDCSISELIGETASTEKTSPEKIDDSKSNLSPSAPGQTDTEQTLLSQRDTGQADLIQTDFDAFLQWLTLSSIKATPQAEDNYLLQIGSKEFHLSEEELHRIMGFLKKQFLKVLLQMAKKDV